MTISRYNCHSNFAYKGKMNDNGFCVKKFISTFLLSLFQLPCFSSKETLIKQDMAERCLIDYCGAADKKDCCMFHIQTMKLSFAA